MTALTRLDRASPSGVADLLKRHGLAPDKNLGQHFLVDRHALDAIVQAGNPNDATTVFEVGAGLGTLTERLAEKAGRVVAVEYDYRLMPVLHEAFEDHRHVDAVYADAMAFDLETLPEDSMLISNLPYQISTAILTRALMSARFSRLVVLVQKEVAQRLAAEPGAPLFGALSVIRSFFGPAKLVRDVSAGSFFPPPAVSSSVVRIDVTRKAPMPVTLERLIRSGYAHRRKTLVKNLVMAGWPKEQASDALSASGLSATVRAEALSIETWLELHSRMHDTRLHG